MERTARDTIFGLAFLLLVIVTFVVLTVWWLESRYNPDVALTVVAGTLGVLCFGAGAVFAHRLARRTLENAGDFLHDMASSEKARAGIYRNYAMMERDAAKAALQAQTIDAKRVDRLAAQQAKIYRIAERKRLEAEYKMQDQPTALPEPTWMTLDDEEDQAPDNGHFY